MSTPPTRPGKNPAPIPITGATRIYAVLADPVAQVGSPSLLNALMREHQTDGVLVPLHVPADALAPALRALAMMPNVGGACITIPHKMTAAALCDELSAAAQFTGAVSVVRFDGGRIIGENFDGRGFTAGLEGEGVSIKGKNILMIGAGGAARAIAAALAESGAARLTIANRSRDRAEKLAAMLREHRTGGIPAEVIDYADAPRAVAEAAIIINATALGLNTGDSLPVALEGAAPDAVVADVIPKPAQTAFLRAAAAAGLATHAGKYMLEYQRDYLGRFLGMI